MAIVPRSIGVESLLELSICSAFRSIKLEFLLKPNP